MTLEFCSKQGDLPDTFRSYPVFPSYIKITQNLLENLEILLTYNWDRKNPNFLVLKLFLHGLTIYGFFILKRLDSLKYTSEIWKCAVIGLIFFTACFTRRFWGIMHDEAVTKTSAWEAISKNTYVRHHCLQLMLFLLLRFETRGEVSVYSMSIASDTHTEVTCWY